MLSLACTRVAVATYYKGAPLRVTCRSGGAVVEPHTVSRFPVQLYLSRFVPESSPETTHPLIGTDGCSFHGGRGKCLEVHLYTVTRNRLSLYIPLPLTNGGQGESLEVPPYTRGIVPLSSSQVFLLVDLKSELA
jgi:hypothetical protein